MDCIFCKIANKEINSNFVYEDDIVMVIMDIDPLCDGHLLIIPKKHYETLFDIPEDVLMHMRNIANDMIQKIMKKLKDKGATLAFNYGDKQTVLHAHMHIVPNMNFDNPNTSKTVEEVYKLLMDE